MPGGNGTGPAGMGPMTGRGAGYCAGYSVPGYANPVGGRGFGMGRGFGRGFGMGRGFGRGFGAGYGRFGAYGYPVGPQNFQPADPKQQLDVLQEQAKYFEGALKDIKTQIEQLQKDK